MPAIPPPSALDRQIELVLIGNSLQALGRRGELPTETEVRQFRVALQEYESLLATEERRARQAAKIDEEPLKPVRWLGDIDTFARDLIFHAARLDRAVEGLFNEVLLRAPPSGVTVQDIFVQYDRARFCQGDSK